MGTDQPEIRLGTNAGTYCVVIGYGRDRKRESLGTADPEIAAVRFADWKQAHERLSRRNVDMTINAILDGYLADRKADPECKAPERLAFAAKALRPFFGHLYPEHILKQKCREYREMRMALGRRPGTARTELMALNSALRWAAAQNPPWIPFAPKVYLGKGSPPRKRYLVRAENEAELLLAGARAPHVRLFIEIGLGTSARAEAILSLPWSRVDLERRMIAFQDPDEDQTSKGRAEVAINDTLLAVLIEAKKAALSDYVIEYHGERITDIMTGIKRAAKRAGLKGITPHVLRHTCGVWMAEGGVDMEEIAQFMGHSSPRVTREVYARYSPEHLRKAARALDRKPAAPAGLRLVKAG